MRQMVRAASMGNLTHYLEFELRSDAEHSPGALMSLLFGRVHLAIVGGGMGHIGLAFPGYSGLGMPGLGERLRVFGSQQELSAFSSRLALRALREYLRVSSVRAVPEGCAHIVYVRRQAKGSPSAYRRLCRRGGMKEPCSQEEYCRDRKMLRGLPFVSYFSTSTRSHTRIFIAREQPGTQALDGEFSSFGLSRNGTTVPFF